MESFTAKMIAGKGTDSKHQRMVAEGKGGLNHICFEVEDIDAALAELKAKGIPLMSRHFGAGGRLTETLTYT